MFTAHFEVLVLMCIPYLTLRALQSDKEDEEQALRESLEEIEAELRRLGWNDTS